MIRYVVTLMLVAATLCAAQTTYKNCTSNATPISVTKVNVPGCTDPPCILYIGKAAAMRLYLEFNADEATVYNKVEAEVGGVWINYPLKNNSGCDLGLKCPEAAKSIDIEILDLTIPGFAPVLETIIRWTLWLDSGVSKTQLSCIELEVKLEKP